MKFVPFIIVFFVVLLFIGIGLLIKYKKAYWLISGYNTMSSEQKKKVDVERLGRLMANMCFVLAAIFFVAFTLLMFGYTLAFEISLGLVLPVIIYSLISAQKYDGNTRTRDGKMNKSTKVLIGSVSVFLVIIGIGVGILFSSSTKPAAYRVHDGIFSISGMYGQEIVISDIQSLELKESIPEITYKKNGSALGDMAKGHFKLEGIPDATLFLNVSNPPFIYLSVPDVIILNSNDGDETRKIFDQLYQEWEKTHK